jgi:hypothetical protein
MFLRHTGLAARNLTATLAKLGLVVETPLLKSRARDVPNLTRRIRKRLKEEPALAETLPTFCQPQEQRPSIPEISIMNPPGVSGRNIAHLGSSF